VTVTGGNIQRMSFYANTNFDPIELTHHYASHSIYGKNVWDPELNQWVFHYLDGMTSFPMKPWVSYDANEDGDYYGSGESYLGVYGYVWISGTQFNLPTQYIDVIVGQPTYVYWDLNVLSSISGSVDVVGEDIYRYFVRGDATIDGNPVTFIDDNFPGSQDYYAQIQAATWNVYPRLYFYDGSIPELTYLTLPTETVLIPPGEDVIHNWNLEPGYVTGSIDFYGANTNLDHFYIYAERPYQSAWTRTYLNDYKLILNEGEWEIGYPYILIYFDYDEIYKTSRLQITNYSIPYLNSPTTVTPGAIVSDVDFSFGTATITVNYVVEGGGELRSPHLIARASEGTWPEQVYTVAQGWGSDELTTFGECTITVLEGTYTVEAYAYVEDSYTKFGEFTVSVEPGDVIEQDIGAPTVDIAQPGGSEHICGSSVDVEGTTTDDSGVSTITVNDEIVEFFPTNNPDDPNEVSFSTTVENLVYGENIITIVVTDIYDNSITVERSVFRDICNLPPEIILISGPLDPVTLGAYYEMTGIFTDPDDGDTHTATWDWGDGTTSGGTVDQTNDIVTGFHEYAIPGVYTVTLTVIDSFEESDTATWSQFIVIYDPSAGFVTGGGWINSPEGAYFADPDLNGKANFGFVAKYKKGSTVPIGNTVFQFQLGDLNFHSDTYQWLVIAGARAKFKGSGTINGEGSYKFMLTAVDGELVNNGGVDKFRLKIWVEDEATGEEIIIYDNMLGAEDDAELNENTEIGGGSIIIHNKPK